MVPQVFPAPALGSPALPEPARPTLPVPPFARPPLVSVPPVPTSPVAPEPALPSIVTARPPHALTNSTHAHNFRMFLLELRFFMADSGRSRDGNRRTVQLSLASGREGASGRAALSSSALIGGRERAPRPILTTLRSTP